MAPVRQAAFATVGQEVVHGHRSQRPGAGHREECVSNSWSRPAGASGSTQAAPRADAGILFPAEAVRGGDRGNAGSALLGTGADRAWAYRAADLAAFREALPEVTEETMPAMQKRSAKP